jgi:hypothetical protein
MKIKPQQIKTLILNYGFDSTIPIETGDYDEGFEGVAISVGVANNDAGKRRTRNVQVQFIVRYRDSKRKTYEVADKLEELLEYAIIGNFTVDEITVNYCYLQYSSGLLETENKYKIISVNAILNYSF